LKKPPGGQNNKKGGGGGSKKSNGKKGADGNNDAGGSMAPQPSVRVKVKLSPLSVSQAANVSQSTGQGYL